MTCQQVDELFSSNLRASELPSEAAEHIGACDRCGRLARALDESAQVAAPSASQLKQIQSALVRDLKPVRPLMRSSGLLAVFGLIFLALVAAGSLLLGVTGWGALSLGQKIVVSITSATGGTLLAVSMARQMVPGSMHVVSPTQLPIAVLTLLILVITALFRPQREAAFVSNGLMCLRIGVAYSIPAAFLTWMVLRRGALLSPKLMGTTTGVFAGLMGVTVLEVYCPNLNLYHILAWHLSVMVLSALAGLILGAAVQHMGRSRDRRLC